MPGGALSVWSRVARRIAAPFVPAHYLAADPAREARVEAVRDEGAGVHTVVLRPARGWRRHRAGQHVRVGLELDGRIATRMYAIASAEDRLDGCIELAVKPRGAVSNALCALEPGARVRLALPEGDFVYEAGAPVRALFVTAGIGIAPVASMLRTFAARAAMPDVVHIHHAPTAAGEVFGAELRALAERFASYRLTVVHTRGDPASAPRMSAARLDELAPDWRARHAWVCAPASLADAVTAAFAGREAALHVERFAAALAPLPEDHRHAAAGGRVRFASSGREAIADGRTPLLRVAEAAGLAVPHGCRMGICHSCDTALIAGRVRDLRTGAVIDEAGARVQVCVCAAAGEVELAL